MKPSPASLKLPAKKATNITLSLDTKLRKALALI
jgi:hypothetical protein